jgi:hypothetical protein
MRQGETSSAFPRSLPFAVRIISTTSPSTSSRFGRGTRRALIGPKKGRFGQAAYAAEELIAELGAAFLAAEFSFDGDVRHVGYIETWIGLLRSDKRAFFTAASKAQAAATIFGGWPWLSRLQRQPRRPYTARLHASLARMQSLTSTI